MPLDFAEEKLMFFWEWLFNSTIQSLKPIKMSPAKLRKTRITLEATYERKLDWYFKPLTKTKKFYLAQVQFQLLFFPFYYSEERYNILKMLELIES